MQPARQAACRWTTNSCCAAPSGDLFGLTQNAGMGWDPAPAAAQGVPDPEHAGRRSAAGRHRRSRWATTPATGRWGCWCRRRPQEFAALGAIPFAGFVTDPCDGRTQGTAGMIDSLPYRNDAAIVLRRLIRSLPTRRGRAGRGDLRQGAAGDDDGAGRRSATCRWCSCPAA